MNFKKIMSDEELSKRIALNADLPLHQFLRFDVMENRPGSATLRLRVSENTINMGKVTHGGIIYSLLDVAAYISVLPMIKDTQNAVTHDIHVSVLRPAPVTDPLIITSRTRKIGKRIAFCDSEAYSRDQLVATGRISKSIIELANRGKEWSTH